VHLLVFLCFHLEAEFTTQDYTKSAKVAIQDCAKEEVVGKRQENRRNPLLFSPWLFDMSTNEAPAGIFRFLFL